MRNYEKLRIWRKYDKNMSMEQVCNLINMEIKKAYNDKPPKGSLIYQADFTAAEKGEERKFDKITTAIYKYMGVDPGYFGNAYEKEGSVVKELSAEYTPLKMIELQEELLRAYKKINQLQEENYNLLKAVNERDKE